MRDAPYVGRAPPGYSSGAARGIAMTKQMVVFVESKTIRHVLLMKTPLPDAMEWQGTAWTRTGPYRYEPARRD